MLEITPYAYQANQKAISNLRWRKQKAGANRTFSWCFCFEPSENQVRLGTSWNGAEEKWPAKKGREAEARKMTRVCGWWEWNRQFDGRGFLGVSESKAAPVFQKIRDGEELTVKDRRRLSEFLTIFWQRSPYQKVKTKTILEDILPKNFQRFREEAACLSAEKRAGVEAELDRLEKWHSENPASLFPRLINIDTQVVDIIESMEWLITKSPNIEFLTSDNPFVYSHGIGIKDFAKGHFIFPLTKHIAMQGTHYSQGFGSSVEIGEAAAEDINLRIVRNSFREVYSSYESKELASFVNDNMGKDLS